ncbi:MAG: hypothetical protein MK135_10255, partial [Polyangiaceae bacterium]|nr:hypothetical protein [Polyangiaceae bacterium]
MTRSVVFSCFALSTILAGCGDDSEDGGSDGGADETISQVTFSLDNTRELSSLSDAEVATLCQELSEQLATIEAPTACTVKASVQNDTQEACEAQ